jgi:hypothetical protein
MLLITNIVLYSYSCSEEGEFFDKKFYANDFLSVRFLDCADKFVEDVTLDVAVDSQVEHQTYHKLHEEEQIDVADKQLDGVGKAYHE